MNSVKTCLDCMSKHFWRLEEIMHPTVFNSVTRAEVLVECKPVCTEMIGYERLYIDDEPVLFDVVTKATRRIIDGAKVFNISVSRFPKSESVTRVGKADLAGMYSDPTTFLTVAAAVSVLIIGVYLLRREPAKVVPAPSNCSFKLQEKTEGKEAWKRVEERKLDPIGWQSVEQLAIFGKASHRFSNPFWYLPILGIAPAVLELGSLFASFRNPEYIAHEETERIQSSRGRSWTFTHIETAKVQTIQDKIMVVALLSFKFVRACFCAIGLGLVFSAGDHFANRWKQYALTNLREDALSQVVLPRLAKGEEVQTP